MKNSLAVIETPRYNQNDRPIHVHTCVPLPGDDFLRHEWECDSAYCQSLRRKCPGHGGKLPRSLDD